ncbi:hypothetical protein [Pontixanthobacter sp.]
MYSARSGPHLLTTRAFLKSGGQYQTAADGGVNTIEHGRDEDQ